MNSEQRICQNCKLGFTIEPDDFTFYEKIKVPPPTWCQECRMIRRFIWRNDRQFFRRKNNRTGEEVFATFPPAAAAAVWDLEFWDSDGWDPLEYGRDYDFSCPFFEQFREFLYSVPWPAKSTLRMTNSEYCNQASDFKDSYLCFTGVEVEGSAYVVSGWTVKDSLDLYQAYNTQLSYGSVLLEGCYRTMFSVDCTDCTDIWFSRDMVGCNNCFGCAGLRKKSYYIFNQPYSKNDYQKAIAQYDLKSYRTVAELKEKAQEFWRKHPVKYALSWKCVNSTGEQIENSKNLELCYSTHGGEDLAYSQFIYPPASDSYDYTNWGQSSSEMYECVTCGEECSRIRFAWECWPGCRDVEYSAFCRSSEDLFACVGLKKKQYCIFNKQYSKEAYFELREKIIRHMNKAPYTDARGRLYQYGEFWPPEFSPYAYNEPITRDFFPLAKPEAEKQGYVWRAPEAREFETTLSAADLPDSTDDVQDDILKQILKCGKCGRAYRIIEKELKFYRLVGLPLPRLCRDCRFEERFNHVNPPKFREAACRCGGGNSEDGEYKNREKHFHGAEHCPNKFQTAYDQKRKEILYCEACYNAEVA